MTRFLERLDLMASHICPAEPVSKAQAVERTGTFGRPPILA
jgi:hypothetical protein